MSGLIRPPSGVRWRHRAVHHSGRAGNLKMGLARALNLLSSRELTLSPASLSLSTWLPRGFGPLAGAHRRSARSSAPPAWLTPRPRSRPRRAIFLRPSSAPPCRRSRAQAAESRPPLPAPLPSSPVIKGPRGTTAAHESAAPLRHEPSRAPTSPATPSSCTPCAPTSTCRPTHLSVQLR